MAAIKGDWYASRSTHNGESYPQDDDTVRFVYATQADGGKFIVAKVWSGDDGDYGGTAKLIAAAPDLLAASRLANQELIDLGVGSSGSPALVALWAAIAKAEGRE
jgi:hypothetical protein